MYRTMPLETVLRERFYAIPDAIFDPSLWSRYEWDRVLSNPTLDDNVHDSMKCIRTA